MPSSVCCRGRDQAAKDAAERGAGRRPHERPRPPSRFAEQRPFEGRGRDSAAEALGDLAMSTDHSLAFLAETQTAITPRNHNHDVLIKIDAPKKSLRSPVSTEGPKKRKNRLS